MKKSIQISVAAIMFLSLNSFAHKRSYSSHEGSRYTASSSEHISRSEHKRMKRFKHRGGSAGSSAAAPVETIQEQQQMQNQPVIEQPAAIVEQPVQVIEQPAPIVEQPAPVVVQPAPVVAPVTAAAITFQTVNTQVLRNCTGCHSSFSKYATVVSRIDTIVSMTEGGHGNLTNDQWDTLRSWISTGMIEK